MHPGERIRQFRREKRITQADFGERVGFTQGYISDLERGRQEPSRDFLKKLTEVYGLSTDYVLFGDENERIEISSVREPEGSYDSMPTSIKKILNNVKEILESKNEVMIDALKANIKAFLQAVRSKTNDGDKNKEDK